MLHMVKMLITLIIIILVSAMEISLTRADMTVQKALFVSATLQFLEAHVYHLSPDSEGNTAWPRFACGNCSLICLSPSL